MGILTDLFVASEDDIDEQILSEGPAERFPSVQAKSVDDVKLTTLNAIATGRHDGSGADFDERAFDAIHAETPMVLDGGDEGPWVFRVPERLVDELVSADEARLHEINDAWAQTEEWELDGVTGSRETAWLVEGLAQLAREARTSGRHVYVWVSL